MGAMAPSIPTTHCRLAFWLILPAYLATLVQAACAPYPVPLRLGNVSLSNGKEARGVELSVGNPEQKFALIPHKYTTSILCSVSNSRPLANGTSDSVAKTAHCYTQPTEFAILTAPTSGLGPAALHFEEAHTIQLRPTRVNRHRTVFSSTMMDGQGSDRLPMRQSSMTTLRWMTSPWAWC